jgi:hypothetical protein
MGTGTGTATARGGAEYDREPELGGAEYDRVDARGAEYDREPLPSVGLVGRGEADGRTSIWLGGKDAREIDAVGLTSRGGPRRRRPEAAAAGATSCAAGARRVGRALTHTRFHNVVERSLFVGCGAYRERE